MNIFTAFVGLLMMAIMPILGICDLSYEFIRDYKENSKRKQNKVRRIQLIKEMKAGTFDEKKMEQMQEELRDLMKGTYYVKYRCVMERNYAGLWTLKTLTTDGYSWI